MVTLFKLRYREIVRRLKRHGFAFDRQATGSHEIWYNSETKRYTAVPNHPGDMPRKTPCGPFLSRREFRRKNFWEKIRQGTGLIGAYRGAGMREKGNVPINPFRKRRSRAPGKERRLINNCRFGNSKC